MNGHRENQSLEGDKRRNMGIGMGIGAILGAVIGWTIDDVL